MVSISSAATEELSPEKAAELFARHQRLRARLRWLLPLGVLLMGVLLFLLLTYPSRTPLVGYRYQQVGVQAGKTKTWWILAHRGARAELLLHPDTSRNWQRHALDVDSSQAHALALDWGGRALLVGLGTVRIYDAQLRRVGPVHYLDSGRFQGRWVAADASGKWAFIIGDHNRTQQTQDGGQTWTGSTLITGVMQPAEVVRRVFVDDEAAYWVSQQGYLAVAYKKQPLAPPNNQAVLLRSASFAYYWQSWPRPLRAPIAWLGLDEKKDLLALDQRGVWVSAHEVDSTSNQQASALTGVAFLPSSPKVALGISVTQVVQGSLSKQLGALASSNTGKKPGASVDKTNANLPAGSANSPKKTKSAKQAPAKTPKYRPVKSKEEPSNDRLPDIKKPRATSAPAAQSTQAAPVTTGNDNAPATGQTPTQNPVQQTTGGKPLPVNSPVQQAPQNQVAPRKEPSAVNPKSAN